MTESTPATSHRPAVLLGDRPAGSMGDRRAASPRDVLNSSWDNPCVVHRSGGTSGVCHDHRPSDSGIAYSFGDAHLAASLSRSYDFGGRMIKNTAKNKAAVN